MAMSAVLQTFLVLGGWMNAAGASIDPAPALAYRIHCTCYIVCIDQVLVKPCLMAGDFFATCKFLF